MLHKNFPFFQAGNSGKLFGNREASGDLVQPLPDSGRIQACLAGDASSHVSRSAGAATSYRTLPASGVPVECSKFANRECGQSLTRHNFRPTGNLDSPRPGQSVAGIAPGIGRD